jgi:hypothetical protein
VGLAAVPVVAAAAVSRALADVLRTAVLAVDVLGPYGRVRGLIG